jgi:ribosomal protein L7Ae-like RNA K-turn-binding protein
MNRNKVLGNIGLANRARAVTSGEDQVLDAIRKKRAILVFLASDAGPNTTKRITDKSSFYNVRLSNEFTADELSTAIGKENRKVIAITNRHFTEMIDSAIHEI